nr:peptidylprolyl isomerase [Victivallales bacterium]
ASDGDKKISREDLVNVIKEITKSFPGASQESVNPDIIKAIAPKLVESMIDKKILLDMAEAEGIKPSAELVIKEFDDMLKTVPQDKIEEFKNALQARGTNMETYSKDLSKSVLAQEDAAINSWVKGKIMSNIKVSEEETKKYYDEHQEAFTTPESVNASHILIKSKSDSAEDMEAAKKRCVEIKADIDKGTSTFEKAAEDFSDCPSGKSAKGSLGEFGRGDMIKEFEDVAFGMKEGSISEPVKTIYGYHIIKLVGHKDKSVKAYADVSNMITEYLKQQQVEKNVKDILDKKKVELNVKINLPEQAAPALPVQVPATP